MKDLWKKRKAEILIAVFMIGIVGFALGCVYSSIADGSGNAKAQMAVQDDSERSLPEGDRPECGMPHRGGGKHGPHDGKGPGGWTGPDEKQAPDDSTKQEPPEDSTKKENPDDSTKKETPDDSTKKESPDNSTKQENPTNQNNTDNPTV